MSSKNTYPTGTSVKLAPTGCGPATIVTWAVSDPAPAVGDLEPHTVGSRVGEGAARLARRRIVVSPVAVEIPAVGEGVAVGVVRSPWRRTEP